MKACIFCGAVGKKMTRGHIVGQQIIDALPKPPSDVPFVQRILVLDSARDEWVGVRDQDVISPRNMPVNIICDPCNGAWMGGFETALTTILRRAQRMPSLDLSRADQQAIATWVCIAAVMSQYLSTATQSTSTGDRLRLRQTSNPPPGTFIWMGKSGEVPWMLWGGIHKFPMSQQLQRPDLSVTITVIRYVYMLIVGPLAFLVADLGPRSEPKLDTKPADAVRQIWPHPRHFTWPSGPPVAALDLDNIRRRILGTVAPTLGPVPPVI